MLIPQSTAVPNAVLVPGVIFSTRIVSGQLKTSALITLASALVDEAGHWTQLGASTPIAIPDVNHLPANLSALSADTQALQAALIDLVGRINAILHAV